MYIVYIRLIVTNIMQTKDLSFYQLKIVVCVCVCVLTLFQHISVSDEAEVFG